MYVYFDIGGTKTRISISEDQKTFVEPVSFPTPEKLDELTGAIHDTARKLGGTGSIQGAGGGIAASVDRGKNALCWGPNLPQDWFKKPFAEELTAVLGCQTIIDNDTAVIGMGEAAHGAGKGSEILVYMTISTGVGGARIVQGQSETVGRSSEPGWQYIDYDKTACKTCDSGNAQILLSGSNMEKRFGVKAYEVTDEKVWEQYAVWTGYMLANTAVHWTPDTFVMGGSMITGAPAIPLDRVEYHLEKVLINAKMPEVKMAELGDFGGIYGAMEFVKHRLSK